MNDVSGAVFDAVVLAGGRGSRLGGVDKAELRLGGERLVDRAVAAAREAGAVRVIAVGPEQAGSAADLVVREDPPYSGPLAGLEAALGAVRARWFLLLACDLERPGEVVGQLRAALDQLSPEPSDRALLDDDAAETADALDGAILIDEQGHRQWLAGCYRSDPTRSVLREAAASEGSGSLADLPLRTALGRLRLAEIPARPLSTSDIDTPDQLARARATSRKAHA